MIENGAMNYSNRVVQCQMVAFRSMMLLKSFYRCFIGCVYCICGGCCAGRLHQRTGEHFLSCCAPGATQGLRTKIRMAYGIRVSSDECFFSS